MQVRLEEPVLFAVKDTLVELNGLQDKPVGTVLVNATSPAKLNVLVRVIVDASDAPALPVGAVAKTVKSPT